MPGILDLLNSSAGKTIVSGVSREANQPRNKTEDVLTMALPLLMTAMKRNASSQEGAQGILNALNAKHDGSILDNLDSLFTGGVNEDVKIDGAKILGHILGNKQPMVTNTLSQKSGMGSTSVAQILQLAAPLLLGMLGKEKKRQNINSQNGLESLLGSLLGGNSRAKEQSFLEAILDANGDGSVIDDVAGMVLGGNRNKGGLGGLLGNFFKK